MHTVKCFSQIITEVKFLFPIKSGTENYKNQLKYGKHTFEELQEIARNGWFFDDNHHIVDIISCCDWKAGACIEGLNLASSKYFCCYSYCSKEEINEVTGS